jgi:transposase InsO family protein
VLERGWLAFPFLVHLPGVLEDFRGRTGHRFGQRTRAVITGGLSLAGFGLARVLGGNNIETIYLDPGCPWSRSSGSYAESFNSRFRIEWLDRELLITLPESHVVFTDWRDYYSNVRPHRSLGLRTPSKFARKQ